MTMQQAIAALGINRAKYELQNMVKALGMASWLNTPQDESRLSAARYTLRHWRAYQEACNKARDKRAF
jgi:putative SOS response-associated peptidase YedK